MNGDLKDFINKKANEKIKKDSKPYLKNLKEDFAEKFEDLVKETQSKERIISIEYNTLSEIEFEIDIKTPSDKLKIIAEGPSFFLRYYIILKCNNCQKEFKGSEIYDIITLNKVLKQKHLCSLCEFLELYKLTQK